jgi:hypothetical protein
MPGQRSSSAGAKLVFAVLLAGAGCLVPPSTRSLPLVVDVRPATGEQAVLRVDGGEGLRTRVTAAGLRLDAGGRLAEFVAPGTLEIIGGEGELELSSAAPGPGFVLGFKRGVAGVRRELEARGQHAVIRVRGGQVSIEAETMNMREIRAP